MQPRSGFARLRPLIMLAGLAAGTVALLACERPVQAPRRQGQVIRCIPVARSVPSDGGRSDVPTLFPAHGLVDAEGRSWELPDIPNRQLDGLDLRNAEWCGVDLRNAFFVPCDFRGCDLRAADLRGVNFDGCDLTGADLTDANLVGVFYDDMTRWPAGFNPEEHGVWHMGR
jgi:hypothetical protein